jgi:hypothetical protein
MACPKEHPKSRPAYFGVVGWRIAFVQRQPDAGERTPLVASLNKAAHDRHGMGRAVVRYSALVVPAEQFAEDRHGILLSGSGVKATYLNARASIL